jgi:23S rRNA G2445 N2-methylase RlmL
MALFNLSSAQLAQLIGLVKEKESLQARLDHVNAELHSLETGKALHKRRGRKPGRPAGVKTKAAKGRKSRRGKRLKEPLLKVLSAAGASGITVKELAAKLKVKPGNIFSWFYTTGKKIKGISKVGEAKYAYSS